VPHPTASSSSAFPSFLSSLDTTTPPPFEYSKLAIAWRRRRRGGPGPEPQLLLSIAKRCAALVLLLLLISARPFLYTGVLTVSGVGVMCPPNSRRLLSSRWGFPAQTSCVMLAFQCRSHFACNSVKSQFVCTRFAKPVAVLIEFGFNVRFKPSSNLHGHFSAAKQGGAGISGFSLCRRCTISASEGACRSLSLFLVLFAMSFACNPVDFVKRF
jgi:hypothetical protein